MARKEYDVRINYSMPLAVMVVAIVVIVLVFAAFAVWHTSPTQMSLIKITSSGTITAVPSEASVYLYLNGTGATSAAAVANLSSIAGTLNQTLMPLLNGNLSDMQTLNYNVYVPSQCPTNNATPYYYYKPYYCIPPGGAKFYVAAETLLVTVPDSTNINGAISKIAQVAGVGVGSVSAKISDSQQAALGQQALTLALANATSQAKALAGSGVQVSVINITVNNGGYFYPVYATSGAASSGNATKNQSSFFVGTVDVTRSVSVVFGVKS